MTSLVKMLEVDFFTQMTRFSAILLWCLKTALIYPKTLSSSRGVVPSRLRNMFFMLLKLKNAAKGGFASQERYITAQDALFQKPHLRPALKAF